MGPLATRAPLHPDSSACPFRQLPTPAVILDQFAEAAFGPLSDGGSVRDQFAVLGLLGVDRQGDGLVANVFDLVNSKRLRDSAAGHVVAHQLSGHRRPSHALPAVSVPWKVRRMNS